MIKLTLNLGLKSMFFEFIKILIFIDGCFGILRSKRFFEWGYQVEADYGRGPKYFRY